MEQIGIGGKVKNGFWFVRFIKHHKINSIIVIAALIWAGHFAYSKASSKDALTTSYRTQAVEKGMIISSVSGSGHVSLSDQVDLKPKASGDIISVKVSAGKQVKQGDILFQIDSSDALKILRNARTDLETAQLDLEELNAPVDELILLQAQHNLETARENLEQLKRNQQDAHQAAVDSKATAEDDLDTAYEDAFNTISDVFLALPDIITSAHDALYGKTIAQSGVAGYTYWDNMTSLSNTIQNLDFKEQGALLSLTNQAVASYESARAAYDDLFDEYKSTTRYSSNEDVYALLENSIQTARKISDSIKDATNMFDYWIDYRNQKSLTVFSAVETLRSGLGSLTSSVNSHISKLLSNENSIKSNQDSIAKAEKDIADMKIDQPIAVASSERNLEELEKKLAQMQEGPDELTLRSKRILIQKAQDNVNSASEDLADYTIRSPFDGVMASVDSVKGDSVSSSSILGTIITKQHIAQITLNEIDAVAVSVGQRAALSFDAIEGLSITGEVVEVDTLGTVTQGVVSYNAKIAFDVQDERVKSGMSVSVSIITQSKQNVLILPLSAVKGPAGSEYVEILVNGAPQRVDVATGIANDTMIEIVSGLEEGDKVITQTIVAGAVSSTQTGAQSGAPAGNSGFGGNAAGGQVFRMMR